MSKTRAQQSAQADASEAYGAAGRLLARIQGAARTVAQDNISGRVRPWVAVAATRHLRGLESMLEEVVYESRPARTVEKRVAEVEAELSKLGVQ
ncbi:hypothetical protein DLJ49_20590 [Rhodovulum sp. 12E13]|uniref:hypothetical protein n=1 Tax=Rhodovulum sp. 12E13 TaxID=2203891 RepID=UPI000E1A7288|nr:hypothetical protein [Rhodovulum sp. 12E13]RDC67997.1 hypothetical protein DLJ49_20590 [Rhodovulum sp. 12E13]